MHGVDARTMLPLKLFSQLKATVQLDGREVPTASMTTKGLAMAVDLSLTVGLVSFLFYVVSKQVPLDTAGARLPIGIGIAVAFAYLVFGRDHVFSLGRQLLRLQLVRLPGNVPGLFGRAMSVHRDAVPKQSTETLTKAILVIALSTSLSMFSLAGSLTTTRIYKTVKTYARSQQINATIEPQDTVLSRLPRALLIGQRRGYVQIDASGPFGSTTLEFFLLRDHRHWRVVAARETKPSMSANFSLGISDKDLPPAPVN
jgi:hypothetical protein